MGSYITLEATTVGYQLIAQKMYQKFSKKCDKLRYFQCAISKVVSKKSEKVR